ncbi:pilin [Patescibacteria group bacterium]|nr:pilin [Patescibacteria group bacterium]
MKNQFLSQSVNFGGQTIQGPLQLPGGQPIDNIGTLVSRVLQFLLPLAGVVLLFVFIWGGYDFMMSQGNPEQVKNARAKITTGLIGFVILILSYFIVRLLATIFGLPSGII